MPYEGNCIMEEAPPPLPKMVGNENVTPATQSAAYQDSEMQSILASQNAVLSRRRHSSLDTSESNSPTKWKRPIATIGSPSSARKRRHSSNTKGANDIAREVPQLISQTRKRRGELFYMDEAQVEQLTMDRTQETKQGMKSKTSIALLERVLGTSFLFSGVSSVDISRIISVMTAVHMLPGDVVIREGDPGDCLYVLDYGTLEVHQKKLPGKVDFMEEGRLFGELALVYDTPRAATVCAASSAMVWCFTREQYNDLGLTFLLENLDNRVSQLREMQDCFKALTHSQLRRVSAVMQEESFEVGEMICRQGEKLVRGFNDKFYTISRGRARVTVASQSAPGGSVKSSVAGESDAGSTSPTLSDGAHKSMMTAPPPSNNGQALLPEYGGFTNPSDARLPDVAMAPPDMDRTGKNGVGNQGSPDAADLTTTVAKLGEGDYFGEMALLRDEPRTANVISLGDDDGKPTICYTLSRGAFEQIVSDSGAIETIESHSETRKENTNEVVLRHHRQHTAMSVTLEKLNILKIIGDGGFSVVRVVQDPATDAVYALKIMNKADMVARYQQEHVRNERRILLASSHPFILSLIRTFKDKNQLYMLMELVQGGELFSRLTASEGGFPVESVRFYAACVTEGLAYLHKKGVAYRDLKLENLVLDAQGYLKIIDFGFAKQLPHGHLTHTLCGTPDYLAPEAVLRQGHNHMVDLWALGVLVYEMITQCSPFADPQRNDQMVVFQRVMSGTSAIDWRMFIQKYETALKQEASKPNPDPRVIEWIQRDYSHTRDMLHRLWDPNPRTRLTTAGLKQHLYFVPKIFWADLREKKITPPWIPELGSPLDMRYFEVDDFSHVHESENVYDGPSDWFEEFGEEFSDASRPDVRVVAPSSPDSVDAEMQAPQSIGIGGMRLNSPR